MAHLSPAEAKVVAKLIAPDFRDYASRYDRRKYPPHVYARVRRAFASPLDVGSEDLEAAILWKYGHVGKTRYPKHHAKLIADVQLLWPAFLASRATDPEEIQAFWLTELRRPKAFITVAFLIHLVHRRLPIIDQHNFRAVNYFITKMRPSWSAKRHPTDLGDLFLVHGFIDAVRNAWVLARSRPSAREMDKFLMMFGKALKPQRRRRATA